MNDKLSNIQALIVPSHGIQSLLKETRVHFVLTFENHTLFKSGGHACPILRTFTTREPAPVQSPADLRNQSSVLSISTFFGKLQQNRRVETTAKQGVAKPHKDRVITSSQKKKSRVLAVGTGARAYTDATPLEGKSKISSCSVEKEDIHERERKTTHERKVKRSIQGIA